MTCLLFYSGISDGQYITLISLEYMPQVNSRHAQKRKVLTGRIKEINTQDCKDENWKPNTNFGRKTAWPLLLDL
jgi:hypothetical protein